jgi:formate dehydrogenase maturation protein FdhE
VKDETRRWVEAGIILAKEPLVVVMCPVCQRAPLEVMDQALGGKKVERHMRCPLCGAYNSILLERT